MRTGTVVQAGLYCESEFIMLAQHNWKKLLVDKKYTWSQRIADELKYIDIFRYFGIDCDPASVTYIGERYKEALRNEHVVLACLGLHWLPKMKVTPMIGWFESSKNSSAVFMNLDMFFDSIGIDDLDLLVLDIEGFEYNVLKSYSWKIKPKVMEIELHPRYDFDKFKEMVKDIGYRLEYSDEDQHLLCILE